MSGWWVTRVLEQSGPVVLCAWIAWVIISIVLHELAHGWMAMRCGDRTPIESNHWTFNPIVHMGWLSLLAFALIGIAWGAMPVNPARFRGRYDEALVALAGPLMNVLIAIVCFAAWIGLALFHTHGPAQQVLSPELLGHIETVIDLGIVLNVALAIFNLIPVPPLDGSRILARFVPAYQRLFATEAGRVVVVVLIILLMSRAGAFIFAAGRTVADTGQQAVIAFLAPTTGTSP